MKNNKMVTFRIIIVLLFIVGLAITSASSIVIFNNYRKSKIYTPITAVVVAYDKKENGLRSIIIEYNIENKYYQITSKHYSSKPEKRDSEIKIKYNPENPSEIIWIDNNHNKKYLTSGLILVSGSILMFLVLNLLDKKKPNKVSLETTGTIELPTVKEVDSQISEMPAEETVKVEETITEEQASKEEIITLEQKELENVNQIINETTLPVEEPKVELQPEPKVEVPTQKVEQPQEVIDPILPKVETPKIIIPELPVDDDSPREVITSNILDMTVAMPALTKEELTIELPIIKQD